jgi:hypothetical protein
VRPPGRTIGGARVPGVSEEAASAPGRGLLDDEARGTFELGRTLRDRMDPRAWAVDGVRGRADRARLAHQEIRRWFELQPRELLFERLPRNVLGGFDPATGEISVNRNLLLDDDPLELLKTLVHENRHETQERRMESATLQEHATGLPVADREVRIWRNAAATYTTRNAELYHYNALEVDSREAEHALESGFLRRHIEHLSREVGPTRGRGVTRRNRGPRRQRPSPGREAGR